MTNNQELIKLMDEYKLSVADVALLLYPTSNKTVYAWTYETRNMPSQLLELLKIKINSNSVDL